MLAAGRDLGAAAVLFHGAMAERMGLSPVEEKALDIILRHPGMAAGELAGRTGLAPSSVTSLIDRLEHKGYLARERHEQDRRRITLLVRPEALQAFRPAFEALGADLRALCRGFSASDLAVIARFLKAAAAVQLASTAALSDRGNSREGRSP